MKSIAIVLALSLVAPPLALQAQELSVGFSGGGSIVAGGYGRTAVGGPDEELITGAGQHGWNARALIDISWRGSPLSLRTSLFYNHLSSGPRTSTAVNGEMVRSALTDQVIGGSASWKLDLSEAISLSPYLTGGVGVFHTRLGTAADPDAEKASKTRAGSGIGVLFGGGVERPVGRMELSLDVTYYLSTATVRGSGFIPVSVGLSLPL